MRLYKNINEAKNYNNWMFPSHETMVADYEEYKKKEQTKWKSRVDRIGSRFPIFKDFEHFQQALKNAKVIILTKNIDDRIMNRSHSFSIENLKGLVSSYIRPRDVDRIVSGFEDNDKIPYPIVLKGSKGMWIMAGNTRLDTSFIMEITPKVLMVDVSDKVMEEQIPITADRIIYILKKDCKPFIKELGGRGLYYRFRRFPMVDNILKMDVRKDRQPKDMSLDMQRIFDHMFFKKFGWKPRSEGVFALPQSEILDDATYNYGKQFIFFPIGIYKYIWSSRIIDLYGSIPALRGKDKNEEAKRLVSSYIDNSLPMDTPHEVTFLCEYYYLVNMKYDKAIRNAI